MRQTFRLRLDEIEGGFYNLSDEAGNKYSWIATGERPILLEGSMFDVSALVAGTYAHNGKTWVKLTRATFMPLDVYSYFRQQLGAAPEDETLAMLPVDSDCGRDCQQAIDAAKGLLECARKADNEAAVSVLQVANEIVGVFWRG